MAGEEVTEGPLVDVLDVILAEYHDPGLGGDGGGHLRQVAVLVPVITVPLPVDLILTGN